MTFRLLAHQYDALQELASGKVLVGGVGSGKSITSLSFVKENYPEDTKIVVITTAKKRDSGEWFADAMLMSLRNELVVDSWNNIRKYENEKAFFIFDEQKLVGKGQWVHAFWRIAKENDWLLLSATPADVWVDLMPVFVANGFFKNQSEFFTNHVIWARFVRYPMIQKYYDEQTLEKYRAAIYVEMDDQRHTIRHDVIHNMPWSFEEEQMLYKDRWNFWDNVPVKDAGELVRLMRKSVNLHPARYEKCKELAEKHDRIIIFYNHDYELEVLRGLAEMADFEIAEWNGHKHQSVPDSERWVYLVQFTAGAEGWNCTSTNHTVIYSLPYSYRVLEQGKGRTDRLNTPFTDLYYHILVSNAIFDRAISSKIRKKKNFQASAFGKKAWPEEEKPKFTRLN